MSGTNLKNQLLIARSEYLDIIKGELLGPGSEFDALDREHELLSGSPLARYSLGILFPQGNALQQDNDSTRELYSEDDNIEGTTEETALEDQQEVKEKKESKQNDKTNDSLFSEEGLDEEISMTAQYQPSSMGVTFLVKGDSSKVTCDISFATYRAAKWEECVIPRSALDLADLTVPVGCRGYVEYDEARKLFKLKSPISMENVKALRERDAVPDDGSRTWENILYRFVNYCKRGQIRVPHLFENVVLDFSKSNFIGVDSALSLDNTGIKVVALRTPYRDGVYSIMIMLVNSNESQGIPKASECVFQSKIEISTERNPFVFAEINEYSDIESMDEEEQSIELLYRNKKTYASGLGTAVDWNIDDSGKGRLWTEYVPTREVPSMNFSLPEQKLLKKDDLSMKYLSDLDNTDKERKLKSLENLVELYQQWIEGLVKTVSSLDDRFKAAASRNIEACLQAATRMRKGIEILRRDPMAYDAFALANRAMFMQRVHIQKQSEMAKEVTDRFPEDEDIENWLEELDYREEADDHHWRTFQIAFILMNIESIVDDDSSERSLVDLIWFPTGGGKTEAYLGLTALTIFYRKLRHTKQSNGTAVIMRYTLRLLTSQQFTRASTLICACEYIRLDSLSKKPKYPAYNLSDSKRDQPEERITIGLWIGRAHIPNTNEEALKSYNELRKGDNSSIESAKEKYNKFQVLKCPWCGTCLTKNSNPNGGKVLGEWGYAFENNKYFFMRCTHESCLFEKRLPIQIIDEELYKNPPTLLFATVDKFAMAPWEYKIGKFFGIDTKNRGPELIVQDELHLISGSLGTMVGMYETAIDGLSCLKKIPPKIIASTATIRRAKEQCSNLYNRDCVQFPAPGIDSEDSFFARESKIDHSTGKFGRLYVGIIPTGRTKAMIEIRTMASLLQRVFTMDLPDEVKDKLWTLTVYFNNLKDLGKASTFVSDDVKDFIIRIANRRFKNRRLIADVDELTSRVKTVELNRTLEKLERVEYTSKRTDTQKRKPVNVLLATNMISVGIDVARLNVMLMVGQPKLTSEYIQASSRVGRSFPGVAFILYDATKSRDRSHYERFQTYHESFYRYVEPTAVTPFAKPVRDRALHAVITTLIRNIASLKEDSDALGFNRKDRKKELETVQNFIIQRVEGITRRLGDSLINESEEIKQEFDDFIEEWQTKVDQASEKQKGLVFGKKYFVKRDKDGEARLLQTFESNVNDARPTLASMRNVDSMVEGKVLVWEDDDEQ